MTAQTSVLSCPACSEPLAARARFCSRCGSPLADADETLEHPARRRLQRARSAPSFHEAQRRPLGLEPVALLGGCETAGVLATIILFAVGLWAAGIVVLVISLVLLALLLTGARREPERRISQLVLGATDRSRSATHLVGVTLAAWAATVPGLVRLKQRRQRLRHELRRQLGPLGEAVYQGDDRRARALKSQARRIEHALAETEQEQVRLLERVRTQLAAERATAQPTESLPAQPPAGVRT